MASKQDDNHIMSSTNPADTTGYETFSFILTSFFYTSLTVLLESLLNAPKNSYIVVLEFTILILPITLGMTVLAEYTKLIFASLLLVLIALLVFSQGIGTRKPVKNSVLLTHFITNARSNVNMLSVIAILAVDFSVFPRRFAKTSTFGYSLMDVGVGLYIYANGIVAPEALGRRNSITKSLKSSVPLFVLGSLRFIATELLHYHVPVTEYGVHWNFFITLGVTKIFSSFILNVFHVKFVYVNAVLLVVAHEVLLQCGLERFVLDNDNDRDNFLKANKEGIVSSCGYVALYLFAVYFGYVMNLKERNRTVFAGGVKFLFGAGLCLVVSVVFQHFFGISRRLANAAYCFWTLFLGIFMTGLYYAFQNVQVYIFGTKAVYSPFIYEAINYNGLAFFLVGNLLTGLVNMSMNTRDASDFVALSTIMLYMVFSCGLMCVLYWKSLKLKL